MAKYTSNQGLVPGIYKDAIQHQGDKRPGQKRAERVSRHFTREVVPAAMCTLKDVCPPVWRFLSRQRGKMRWGNVGGPSRSPGLHRWWPSRQSWDTQSNRINAGRAAP